MSLAVSVQGNTTYKLEPLYSSGRAGQVIVLTNVSYNKDHRLYSYEQPALFTITEVIRDEKRTPQYRVVDSAGVELILNEDEHRSDSSYFYDAQAWAKYTRLAAESTDRSSKARIAHLESQRDLLKSILTPNGVYVVPVDVAKAAGVTKP